MKTEIGQLVSVQYEGLTKQTMEVEITIRIMTKNEAEAMDARIIAYSQDWSRSGDNLSDSPSIGAV